MNDLPANGAAVPPPIPKRLRHWILTRTLGQRDPAFMFLLDEAWTMGLAREYLRARRYASRARHGRVRRVIVFSYSRSGTHNALSRLHYLPGCFVLKENVFRTEGDPYQLAFKPEDLSARIVLCRSMFGEYGLQNKAGTDLDCLFLWNNYYLEDPEPLALESLRPDDRIVFYIRNFLRVLCSRDKAARIQGKSRWAVTDELFRDALRRHRVKLSEMLTLTATAPQRTHICFHERFCAKPDAVMGELCDALDVPTERRAGWADPRGFFVRCFGSTTKPVEKEGRLWCQRQGKFILGTGGEFNPLPQVSLARTMADRVDEWLTPSRRADAEAAFGRPLVEHWISDAGFPYANVSNEELLDPMRRAVSLERKP